MRLGLLALFVAGSLSAQTVPRPRLDAGQDSNNARAYYYFGFAKVHDEPLKARQAFYWATRLDPSMAEAWYGLWAATVLSLPDIPFQTYVFGGRNGDRDPVVHAIDSLAGRAIYLNPLLHEGMYEEILKRATGDENLNEYIFAHPTFGGLLAYSRGDFKSAVDRLARAIKEEQANPARHWYRGRAFLLALAYDSALAEMRAYRDAINAHVENRTPFFLQPQQVPDYAIGQVEEMRGDTAGARAEYESALVQDLSYVPAHVALARLALARHDTTEALKELDLATQDADADRCYTYGVLLWASRKPLDAAKQFTRAIASDSDYAPPYISLAYLVEASGDDSLAAVLYRNFIGRASKALVPQLQTAHQHLAAIEARKK